MKFLKALASTFTLLCAATTVHGTGIASHLAVYDIKLDRAQSVSDIKSGIGKLVIELKGSACTGYEVAFRFVTQLTYENGSNVVIDSRGENFESGDGKAFDFSNTTYQNNKLTEDTKGIASHRDGQLAVKLTKPEPGEINLADDIIFPAQHIQRLVEKAKAGETLVTSTVYEGVEGGKEALDITAVISKEKPVEKGQSLAYQELEDMKLRRWYVSLSYFNTDQTGDATPQWQNSFLLYENGISRQFTFDYGDFALKGKLKNLDLLPQEDCS